MSSWWISQVVLDNGLGQVKSVGRYKNYSSENMASSIVKRVSSQSQSSKKQTQRINAKSKTIKMSSNQQQRPYISRVEITNFRNFQALAVELQPTIVIVGENRSGKSNFIEALRLVLDPSLPDSSRSLRAEDFWDGLDHPFAGNTIEVKVFLRGLDMKAAKSVLSDCVVEQQPLTARLTFSYRPRATINATDAAREADYEFIVYGGSDEKNRIGPEVRKWIALVVLPALRDAETDLQTWRRSPLRPLLDRARPSLEDKRLKTVSDLLDKASNEFIASPAITELSQHVNERIVDLVGGIQSVKTELAFRGSEPLDLLRSLRLFVAEGEKRPISQTSLGTANVIFLSLLLQNLEEKLANSELVSTVLAIEEPEAHLHPHVQRLLFRHFLNRRQTALVTTHSPNIASVSPLRSLVLLRATGGSSKCLTVSGAQLTDNEVQDIERYLDVTRADVLFARGVILVEGSAEQFLAPVFAESWLKDQKIARTLDDLGISICAVNGTDFAPYSKLLGPKGLDIPYVVITDGDPGQTKGGAKVFYGLNRGERLLADAKRAQKVAEHLSKSQFVSARLELSKSGIFVGQATLELDLIKTCPQHFKDTYLDFKNGKRFAEATDDYLKDGDAGAAGDILSRIEGIGKGRFAQRLASRLTGKEAPDYFTAAIEHIVQLVSANA